MLSEGWLGGSSRRFTRSVTSGGEAEHYISLRKTWMAFFIFWPLHSSCYLRNEWHRSLVNYSPERSTEQPWYCTDTVSPVIKSKPHSIIGYYKVPWEWWLCQLDNSYYLWVWWTFVDVCICQKQLWAPYRPRIEWPIIRRHKWFTISVKQLMSYSGLGRTTRPDDRLVNFWRNSSHSASRHFTTYLRHSVT